MRPYLEVIGACLIFATGGVFIKYLNLPPTSIAFFRMAIPAVVMGGYLLAQHKKIWPHTKIRGQIFKVWSYNNE